MNPLLHQLQALPLVDCLRGLAAHFALQKDAADPVLPQVELMASIGFRYEGVVVRVESPGADSSNAQVLLAHGALGQKSGVRVSYLPLRSVVGITFCAAETVASLLTKGLVARTDTGDAPSRLQMRRHLADAVAERVRATGLTLSLEADMEALPSSSVAMCNLKDVCDAIPNVLEGLVSDPLGREALEPLRTLRILHASGAYIGASRSKAELTLSLDLEGMLPGGLAAVLEAELSRVL